MYILLFCWGMLSSVVHGVTSSDAIYIRMTQEQIQATKNLEYTTATRPIIQTSNHYHHDVSTNYTSVNSVKQGNIQVSQTYRAAATGSGSPVPPATIEQTSWWQKIKQLLYPSKTAQGTGFFSDKRDIAYKTLLIGYAFVNFRLFRLSLYLQDAERWYLWKQDLPLAQLIILPQHDLAQSLVADVRQRYGAVSENKDVANPFGLFMQALEEETAMLNSYQTLSKILLKVDDVEHRCLNICCDYMPKVWGFSLSYFMTFLASKVRVKTLFYLDDALLQAVPERLARLAYIKKLFAHWLAEHKLYAAKKMLGKESRALRSSVQNSY